MYAGICLLYGTRIPALWDTYSEGMSQGLRAPPCWTSLFDLLHEHLLSLLVFILNLILIVRAAPLDMLLNCVALEFVSNLDNEFQERFLNRVQIRESILNSFVTRDKWDEMLKEKVCLRGAFLSASILLSTLSISILLLFPLCLLAAAWAFLC